MNIVQATREYEQWLARHTAVVSEDLDRKHTFMKRDVFSFLRATCYRWMQVWPNVCIDLIDAPQLLAIGDLHIDNFGTWRDQEGRLVWGVNDFDEAAMLPYTNDLVRLATSALVAAKASRLTLQTKPICEAILTGYLDGLKAQGRPFVLAERHRWLRQLATNKLRDPVRFWRQLLGLPRVTTVPSMVRNALEQLMPTPEPPYTVHRRISGLGSLGRPRFVAIASWQGGAIAREAKALTPSTASWAHDKQESETILYTEIVRHAVRCQDPFVRVEDRWLVRRLSPYCSRIEFSALPKKRDERKLLYAMGWETANVHLGSQSVIAAVKRDLRKRKAMWLTQAAKAMAKVMVLDWKEWASH